jgi:adenine-specific DNA-methyltransferase
VYYTPQYIVEYIVQNTVGKLIENKTPKEIEKIKILDPASGSGSFLLGAYDFLLKYHLDWYSKNATKSKGKKDDPLNPDGSLSTEIKKKILLNNVFGVDIDANAVEVTKLSLLLKCLEGETQASLKQLDLFNERVLPTLDDNIKSGNSLVDTDFFEMETDPDVWKKIKPFNWKIQFPEVFKQGGFDAVIGNPPYTYHHDDNSHAYFDFKYKHQNYQQDLYLIFLEQYGNLISINSLLGVIVSNTWLQSISYKNIREYLITNYTWRKILHLPDKVFKAVVDTHVLIFEKNKPNKKDKVLVECHEGNNFFKINEFTQAEASHDGASVNILANKKERELYNKLQNNSILLSSISKVFNGVKPFEKGKGSPPQTEKIMKEKPYVKEDCIRPSKKWSPLLRGSLINRYKNLWANNSWILYGSHLAAPRDPEIFSSNKKIMIRQTSDSIIATIIGSGFIARNNIHLVTINEKKSLISYEFILGQLNSKLIDFYYTFLNPEKGEALAEVKKYHVENLIISKIDFANKPQKQAHDKIVSHVKKLLELNKSEEPDSAQIMHYENQVDKLVYELYGLSADEIKIIEEATSGKS